MFNFTYSPYLPIHSTRPLLFNQNLSSHGDNEMGEGYGHLHPSHDIFFLRLQVVLGKLSSFQEGSGLLILTRFKLQKDMEWLS